MNWKENLEKAWAKSDGTSIREHTDRLHDNLKKLKELYGDRIEKACPERYRKYLWHALELACEYHDYGKLHCKFQREVVGNKSYYDKNIEKVKHNMLSPAFIEEDNEILKGFEDEKKEFLKQIVGLCILHHHDYKEDEKNPEIVKRVLKEEFNIEMEEWHEQILEKNEIEVIECVFGDKLGVDDKLEDLERFYRLLKGLLLRIDHSSSNELIEAIEKKPLGNVEEKIKEKKGFEFNDLQKFVLENRDENLLVYAPTGSGKTEAAYIYLEGKGFYTIPIRTSANAIYLRAVEIFGEDNCGLLHSTALNFLYDLDEKKMNETNDEEERNKIEGLMVDYEYSRNFAKPLIVCTPDQIFPFVFAYKGAEKIIATLSYSKIVVDEFQLFEPHTLGFLVGAIQKAIEYGSKAMLMSATIPEFVRKDLLKNLYFKEYHYDAYDKKQRHHLKLLEDELGGKASLELIVEKAKNKKVLVITNTVGKAVDIYEELKKKGLEPNLLHSRFILKHRREKEKSIKKFFDNANEKGVWITTQLAEVSLDIDADYLFTEYSTPDSLFQRLGRVNRKGEKSIDEPNAYVFLKNCSGIGPVYRKSLHEETKAYIKEGVISEEDKKRILEEVYSETKLKEIDKEYIDDYEKAREYIKSLWESLEYFETKSRKKAQKLFRDILSITVIPKQLEKEVRKYIDAYEQSVDREARFKALKEIIEYTFSIPLYYVKEKVKVEKIKELKGFEIYWVEGNYSEEHGFEISQKKL